MGNFTIIIVLSFVVAMAVLKPADQHHAINAKIPFTDDHRNRPNIILFLSDDQDIELGSMDFMPNTLQIFGKEGAEFLNGMVTTPICCPSRTSILTGLYVHNHNVHSNNDNCTGAYWQTNLESSKTFGVHLQNTGYKTAYFGKYLNEYNGSYVPPGWDEWMGLIRNSRFYNYTINYNGAKIKHGDDYGSDYLTDLIVNDSLSFFQRHFDAAADFHQPVLAVLSFPAPHGPEDPAPQYSQLFANITSHRTPNWNYAPNPDKQWILQRTGKMEPIHVAFTDFLHRRRLQTLQSIDDGIYKIFNALNKLKQIRNTYMIYTSDHGYHLGQFGLIKGKSMPYDFDLRVPYFIRGPEIVPGTKFRELVLNIDIAPTILDMAGVSPDLLDADGRSLLTLLKYEWSRVSGPVPMKPHWRHTALIERGLRPKLLKLRERLIKQKETFSKELRIEKECKKSEYESPCKAGQQWECKKDDYTQRYRIFKCRRSLIINNDDCNCDMYRTKRLADDNRTILYTHLTNDSDYENAGDNDFIEDLLHTALYDDGDTVPEAVMERWEDEFLTYVSQKEIVDGKWYQGRFDAVQDAKVNTATEDNAFLSSESVVSRTVRSEGGLKRRKHYYEGRHRRRELTMFIRRCWLSARNKTKHGRCRKRYANLIDWRLDMAELDLKIKQLRNKLQGMLGAKKHLKKKKPPTTANTNYSSASNSDKSLTTLTDPKPCSCRPHSHPLRAQNTVDDISYSDLIAIAEHRRKMRTNQNDTADVKDAGRKKKGRKRKGSKSRRNDLTKNISKKHCTVPDLNCFTHDNSHWKTPPHWTLGPFCFCQNANNNTYWCLRTVNSTHDFLYCEFVTGFVSFYDMTKDKYQVMVRLYNTHPSVTFSEKKMVFSVVLYVHFTLQT